MEENIIVKFFTHPYTIIFFLGSYLFMILSIVVHGIIYPSEPMQGITDATTPEISIWGIVFMICLSLFLFGLWFHNRYKIIKKEIKP